MATKAQLEAIVARAMAAGPNATAPASQGWMKDAAALLAPKVAPKYGEPGWQPKPLLAEIVMRHPDPAKGQTFAPFATLKIHNGGRGWPVSLDSRYLSRIVDFLGTPEGQAFVKTRQLPARA